MVTSHAEHLILAKTEWEPTKQTLQNQGRTRLRNVVSDESDATSSSTEAELPVISSDEQGVHQSAKLGPEQPNERESNSSDSYTSRVVVDEPHVTSHLDDDEYFSVDTEASPDSDVDMIPFEELARPLKRQREGSSDEEDIPLAELSRRLNMRKAHQRDLCAVRLRRNSCIF